MIVNAQWEKRYTKSNLKLECQIKLNFHYITLFLSLSVWHRINEKQKAFYLKFNFSFSFSCEKKEKNSLFISKYVKSLWSLKTLNKFCIILYFQWVFFNRLHSQQTKYKKNMLLHNRFPKEWKKKMWKKDFCWKIAHDIIPKTKRVFNFGFYLKFFFPLIKYLWLVTMI